MRTFELGELIAERQLTFVTTDGVSKEVVIRLGRPVQDVPDRAWVCPYQVSGLGRDRVTGIFGVDSMQALLLAIHTIPAELSAFIKDSGGRFLHNSQIEDGFTSSCRFVLELTSAANGFDDQGADPRQDPP
ncbi:MAG TPA: hypothetical protein VJS64_11905 [Pyrinomonadaceae bacterium]|nr:hypothetical protein [Pyrinomonadaceae bacterium]